METNLHLPRKIRAKMQKIINSMTAEERELYERLAAEDEELLAMCLVEQYAILQGNTFDLNGIEKHFRIAQVLLGADTDGKKPREGAFAMDQAFIFHIDDNPEELVAKANLLVFAIQGALGCLKEGKFDTVEHACNILEDALAAVKER